MRITPTTLYRQGNAIFPRIDNVRPQDIETYESDNEVWVVANSGGISTFATQGRGKNWWRLNQGSIIPDQIELVNDYGNHWSWEPRYTMVMEEYKAALRQVDTLFEKVS